MIRFSFKESGCDFAGEIRSFVYSRFVRLS